MKTQTDHAIRSRNHPTQTKPQLLSALGWPYEVVVLVLLDAEFMHERHEPLAAHSMLRDNGPTN